MPSGTLCACTLMAVHWTCISEVILVSFIRDDPLGINATSCGPSLCMWEQSPEIPYCIRIYHTTDSQTNCVVEI